MITRLASMFGGPARGPGAGHTLEVAAQRDDGLSRDDRAARAIDARTDPGDVKLRVR